MKNQSIIFGGYRSWSLKILEHCKKKYLDYNWYHAYNQETLRDLIEIESVKLVILAGWSWIIPKRIIEKKDFVGFHPSNLPDYAGGSPIQNQILDGITMTKMSLYKLDDKIDHGDILYKQDMSLEGSIDSIFDNMTKSSIFLIDRLMNDYPKIKTFPQAGIGKKCKRIKPFQSKIDIKDKNLTAISLYNAIRCREDPYPNAYFEDETGRLYFKKASFKKVEK